MDERAVRGKKPEAELGAEQTRDEGDAGLHFRDIGPQHAVARIEPLAQVLLRRVRQILARIGANVAYAADRHRHDPGRTPGFDARGQAEDEGQEDHPSQADNDRQVATHQYKHPLPLALRPAT